MKPSNYTKRALIGKANSTMLIVAVVGSMIISMGLVVGKLLWDQHSFNSEVIGKKELARDTLKDNLSKIDELKRNLESLDRGQTNSKTVLDALPSKYDFPAVASSLDLLAEKAVIPRGNFEFSGEDTAEKLDSSANPQPISIPFKATVVADTTKVIDFLTKTELSIRPFKATKLSFKAEEGNNVELAFEGETYYQPRKSLEITYTEIKPNSSAKDSSKK